LDGGTNESEGREQLDSNPIKDSGYWTPKFVVLNITILFLAIVAGYLQYVAYPALLSAPMITSGGNGPFGFGETNVVLNLSFLTFQINAVGNCSGNSCELRGVPAFDFCQAMVYLVIIVNVIHSINRRRL